MKNNTQIRNELWRRGDLEFLLRPEQHKIIEALNKQSGAIRTLLASRRLGKTFGLLVMAGQICLKKPFAIVKYICPKQNQGERNLKEDMRDILKTCPIDCTPVWVGKEKAFIFPNGSQIQVAGTDNGNHENIRGGSADMCIVDEAGFCDHLGYVIRSVLRPTILHTKGCVYLVSTPSRSATHPFIVEFVNPLKALGTLDVLDIYESSILSKDDILAIAKDYPGGVENAEFQREYLCLVTEDGETKVIPEATSERLEEITVDNITMPAYYDAYVSGDIGFKDLTAYLFAFWDFSRAKLVIIDELIIHGPSLQGQSLTDFLADGIKEKESMWFNTPTSVTRVMDNDLIVIDDLHIAHDLLFLPTAKDNKDSAVNMLRLLINNNQLEIHSRCKHLKYHLAYGQWDEKSANLKSRKFKHIPNSPDKTIRGGHADALDALIYLNRNVHKSKNPYPHGYGIPNGDDIFVSPKIEDKIEQTHEAFQQLINGKSRAKQNNTKFKKKWRFK